MPPGDNIVTVFGGTGFLGRRIVRHLRDHGYVVRVAARHPIKAQGAHDASDPGLHPIQADIRDEPSVASAVMGAYGVINAVSLYAEHGNDSFHSIHVAGAERVASQSRAAGVARLVQISGIGADVASRSLYIRMRGEGEAVVRAAFDGATIVRPAVMFAVDDAFLNTIIRLLRRLPVYPMFGDGRTRLQPASADNVAEAIARTMSPDKLPGAIYECGGPKVYTYEELLRCVGREAGLSPTLIPVPFPAWQALAFLAELLPGSPLARNQVELMQIDTVASPDLPGLAALGIMPEPLEPVVRTVAAA